ncbi:YceI family protein [Flavobacterium branchiicola]|uniref:YceI family protein n=1 Tax=Flavobacterium branchiicola TaxID=1114875 RepID=A0ABV9PFZ1_9FLAO|nr:YceI family protein [Flavobacterium branchiicola]MBS7254014.1 YceI family protein [Flavobacterium branchiicola]
METQQFKLESAKSKIDWIGRKVTGSHNGTIDIKEGELVFNQGQLSSGKVVIDTTSIKILDVTDPATNAQFAGHLASDDFFNSAEYPEALFVITSATSNIAEIAHVQGNLTIKGITNEVAFDAAITTTADSATLAGKIVIDRTKYNIKFRSGNFFKDLGDTLIYNDFDLTINVTAKIA